MSQLRHCDIGNHEFSVRTEGWGSARITWHNRYQDGTQNDVTDDFDICAQHGAQWRGPSVPSPSPTWQPAGPAIEAPAGKKLVDAEEHDRYVAWLESRSPDADAWDGETTRGNL